MTDIALDGPASLSGSPASRLGEIAARRDYCTEVHLGASAYKDLRAEWEQLERVQQSPVPFQTPDLLEAWARHFANGKSVTLATVVVRAQTGRVVLIWPLLIERQGFLRIARGAGTPVGQYDAFLVDPEYDASALLAEALAGVQQSARPDLIFLERVRADSGLREALGPLARPTKAEGAAFADVSGGVEALFTTLKSRVLQQQRKRVRRFEQEGNVGFEVADSPVDAERWLMEAMQIKREWLRSTGRVSRAFAKSELADLLADYARTITATGASPRMVTSRLTLDGRTAAIEMGFCHRGAYHLYLGAFAPDLAKFGAGNILTEKLLYWCAENGITRYDMMAPRSRNKSEWQSGEIEVFDFAIPTNWRGRLYLEGIVNRAMPTARNVFYRLPPPVRSAIAGILLSRLGKELERTNNSDVGQDQDT